ncbi:MAG: GGDEF domain-containing protein [Treponemataceae bacterium]|nr:GGDEF domain-containing protein [Treponemataceae bacterium]
MLAMMPVALFGVTFYTEAEVLLWRAYIWAMYTMLTLYMAIGTVLLGYNYGFKLYSMSTIPLIYYVKYISHKIGGKDPKPVFWSAAITLSCFLSSLYTVHHGSYYHIEGAAQLLFLGTNIFCVCSFLFIFSYKTIKLVTDSEQLLDYQANHDALTGLANRYFMREILNRAIAEQPGKSWLAMIDIDNFKKINDGYGHNTGDEVLKVLAAIMEKMSPALYVSRWGGEEFLIHGMTDAVPPAIVEDIRKTVEEYEVSIGDTMLRFTITAGVSVHESGQPMDRWIISADHKLYSGKENGKNQVVY